LGDWIPVTDGENLDDKPRWSPDGNLLYFTSERDGFRCIWAQRLDAVSKRPVSAPFGVYHFHTSRRSLMNVGLGPLEISVARNALVFNLGEITGNIWRVSSR
jgi:eukaryotic-like serine/threonine-protein kinase